MKNKKKIITWSLWFLAAFVLWQAFLCVHLLNSTDIGKQPLEDREAARYIVVGKIMHPRARILLMDQRVADWIMPLSRVRFDYAYYLVIDDKLTGNLIEERTDQKTFFAHAMGDGYDYTPGGVP